IFRAAHSIKGGAGTFGCFGILADTTHLLENLLDYIRRGEMTLRKDMIDLFLETKDVLTDQVAAYRNQQEPSQEAYERICAQLRALAEERLTGGAPQAAQSAAAPAAPATPAVPEAPAAPAAPEAPAASEAPAPQPEPAPAASTPASAAASSGLPLKVQVVRLKDKDMDALAVEMALMGEILKETREGDTLTLWLQTTTPEADISAVCCFIVNEDQVKITYEAAPASAPAATPAPTQSAAPAAAQTAAAQPAAEPAAAAEKPAEKPADKPAAKAAAKPAASAGGGASGSSTIRVGVEKVDQIINLVGELVITQAMLVQTASTLDPVLHDRLLNGIEQLDRNARDLQEAVMSIRMVPMDYVFSRFPRVVREAASKMG